MNKLYRYRPLTDFIFKELYYGELYFASYNELNDPLDLSVRMDFRPINERQIKGLIHYLVRTSMALSLKDLNDFNKKYIHGLQEFINNEETTKKFCNRLYNDLISSGLNEEIISYDVVEKYVIGISEEFKIEFRLAEIKNELLRLTKVFFESSYITCFSETCTDFLMWSHYASKHSGICLEFSLEYERQFPYVLIGKRKPDKEKYIERYSEWEVKESLFWDSIKKIDYGKTLPSINFYDFLPVFENEGDCDLMGLSKSRWHEFAYDLERVFSVKTMRWEYEKEWRAIEINFDKSKNPEERIRHYPIEALTGVYFGFRTPKPVKERIFNILHAKNEEIEYLEGHLPDHGDLEFKKWESMNEE